MSHLPIIHRVPLPEPLTSAHACVRRDGRRIVAIEERSGRLWRLEIDPGLRTCDAQPTPITVPRCADREGWDLHDLSGSESLDRLLVWTDQPVRVYALPSGDVLAELWVLREGAMCLSPGGRWVIRLEEERGTVMDLDASIPSWLETPGFHNAENASGEVEWIFLDHVDGIAVHPRESEWLLEGEDEFWLAAALYGEVIIHFAEADVGVRRLGETRTYGPMVYDPTYLVRPWGHRHLFVLHGYGMGLVALDPETGERHDCLMRPPEKRPYAFFSGVVPCGQAPLAWGRSVDGSFLWRVGDEPKRMPDAPGAVLALYPGALLCLAPDGTELLWCDLSLAADG